MSHIGADGRTTMSGSLKPLCMILLAGVTTVARPAKLPPLPNTPVIETQDVDRFFRTYDAAGGHPSAEQLQRDYLDAGSEGLHILARLRGVTGQRIADKIAAQPSLYSNARRCATALPASRERLAVALGRLRRLYPAAKLPAVTIAIGRGKPVGIGSPVTGLQIGLEALCGVTYFDPSPVDRFVHVVAHEYVHVQQSRDLDDDPHPTVLEASLVEGAAEFIGEMISGGVSYPQLRSTMRGHEAEIERAFVADEDSRDLSKWLYNGTIDRPGDLGYRVGYRIVKSYYRHARSKRAAIREIIEMDDPKAFLAKSGWRPGAVL
jgi:hypothetical protein